MTDQEGDPLRTGFARGDDWRGDGPKAKASIEGGFAIAIIALVVSFMALFLSWYGNMLGADSRAESVAAAERAELANATTRLGREYIVTTFAEIQRELAKHDLSVEGPMGHHAPVPDELYDWWDAYVAEHIDEALEKGAIE